MGSWGDGAWTPGLLPGEGRVPPPKAHCRPWHQSRRCLSPSPAPVALQGAVVSPCGQGLAAVGAAGGVAGGRLSQPPVPAVAVGQDSALACVSPSCPFPLQGVHLPTNKALTLVAHPKGQGALCRPLQQLGFPVGSQGVPGLPSLAHAPERTPRVAPAFSLCPGAA